MVQGRGMRFRVSNTYIHTQYISLIFISRVFTSMIAAWISLTHIKDPCIKIYVNLEDASAMPCLSIVLFDKSHRQIFNGKIGSKTICCNLVLLMPIIIRRPTSSCTIVSINFLIRILPTHYKKFHCVIYYNVTHLIKPYKIVASSSVTMLVHSIQLIQYFVVIIDYPIKHEVVHHSNFQCLPLLVLVMHMPINQTLIS